MSLRRGLVLTMALPLAACASAGNPPVRVDLQPARAALEEARKAGAPERAAETFHQAETHLQEAEALSSQDKPSREKARQAEFLAWLAATEARCAVNLSRLEARAGAAEKAASRPEEPDLAPRLRRAEEERRRLDERVALLQRELELTETEVVRTKARLQGMETKAEASSAIAEARILMGRLAARDREALSRCQELLDKAERQIRENNYGAAVFFARKAQDIATKAHDERSPPSTP